MMVVIFIIVFVIFLSVLFVFCKPTQISENIYTEKERMKPERKISSLNRKEEAYNRLVELEQFKVEAPNRIRIFKDSLRLIQDTNNVKTFVGRCKDLIENLNWISNQVSRGMPLNLSENPWKMRNECYVCINSNALRLALLVFNKWNALERKKSKRFDNATISAFENIDSLLCCINYGDNKFQIKDQITEIRNTIEDIYSEIK